MSRVLRALVLLLLCLVAWLQVQAAQAAPQQDRCVILVSVDGLAGFYLDDPKADMPIVHRLAREGARASGMVCAFPTVTWPNHTTLATGATPAKHGVIGNSYLDRATGKVISLLPDPVLDKDEIVKVPTIYDAAHQAGLKTASICWPASRNAKTLDWTVPDMFGEGWEQFGTKSWLAELRAAGLPVDCQGPWAKHPTGGVQRDWLYVRMARHVLLKHAPNLLLIHLVEPDHVQHNYGPRSPEAYWCTSYADDRVRDIVEAVAQSSRAKSTTIFVCGDHGFQTIRRDIRPNVLLRKLGLIQVSGGKVQKQAAVCLSQGGASMVYILNDSRRAEIAGQLQKAFQNVEGIQAVLTPDEFTKLGQPTAKQDPHGADLWLAAKPDYSFSDTSVGDDLIGVRKSVGGTHGFLPDQPDLLSACVVWGPGVKPGTKLGKIQMIDIAPTIASILGVPLPTADGKPLRAIVGE